MYASIRAVRIVMKDERKLLYKDIE